MDTRQKKNAQIWIIKQNLQSCQNKHTTQTRHMDNAAEARKTQLIKTNNEWSVDHPAGEELETWSLEVETNMQVCLLNEY